VAADDVRAEQAVTSGAASVLVTGASGFIGRPLVTALAGAGYAVRAAVRDRRGQSFPSSVGIAALPDLTAPADWSSLVTGMDAVVHLAAIAHIGPGVAQAVYEQVNHRATADLAHACAKAGVRRLVFVSSIRAQSAASAPLPLTEADEALPDEPYGRSKLAAEAAVRASGVPYTILRPVLVYGPAAKGNLASLMRLTALPIPMPFGRLTNRRSMLSVDNMIAAARFSIEDERAANETFIVSDPGALSMAETIAILRAALGRNPALLSVPPSILATMLGLVGQRASFERLAGTLIAEPAKLIAAGWRPVAETKAALQEMAQQARRADDA
jgi:nucleoside-diphosphate-sugar epimerase